MAVSYKNLINLLIDRILMKDLRKMATFGSSTMTKLANNENITVEMLVKNCAALECKMDDNFEILPDEES